jgi:hypothetical protein
MTTYVVDYLECVAAAVRLQGWHKAEAGAQSTANVASSILVHGKAEVTLEDVKMAGHAMEWILGRKPESEFEQKVKQIVENEEFCSAGGYEMKIVAPLITMYLRATEVKQSNSQHFGKLKERMMLAGYVLESRFTSSQYGDSYLTKIDVGGNLVTFYHKTQLTTGSVVKFIGTVVDHKEYRGEKSTRVNRVVIG